MSRRRQTSSTAAVTILVCLIAACASADDCAAIGTRSNFFSSQYKAAAFRNMDRLFFSRTIHKSGMVSELPRDESGLDASFEWNQRRVTLDEFLAETRTTGFLVIKDGRIVIERYYLGANENSLLTSWSVAKSFTSTLVGIAIAEGKIASVDDPITNYVPELKESGYDGVPIGMILQMSSGIRFVEEYLKSTSDSEMMWDRGMVKNSEPLNDYVRSLQRAVPPGTQFTYKGADTQALGWMVARATGRHLADYLSEKVWAPLGTEHDATWLTDAAGDQGMEAAFCCINATLRDFGRFGLLFLNRGRWQGRQLVPDSWVASATVPLSPQVEMGKLYKGYPLGYGYQWWAFAGQDHAFSGQGIYFQFLYVNPVQRIVIVKTSAFDTPWDAALAAETYASWNAIATALQAK